MRWQVQGGSCNKEPYTETCAFENAVQVILLNKKNDKVSITVDITANEMHAVRCVFDNDVGLNFIRKTLFGT